MTSEEWPPLPESIQTPRLLLRRYRVTDAEDAYAYARDPEWGRFLPPVPRPYERRHADEFVAGQVLANWDQEPAWAIEHDGRVVGGVSLRLAPRNERAELGYSIARWLWGRGLTTEAVSAVIDEAFRCLPLRKIAARAAAASLGSIRVMEKVGMQYEGRLRQHWVVHDQICDSVHYGLLREEWETQAGTGSVERRASR